MSEIEIAGEKFGAGPHSDGCSDCAWESIHISPKTIQKISDSVTKRIERIRKEELWARQEAVQVLGILESSLKRFSGEAANIFGSVQDERKALAQTIDKIMKADP